jgi:hypothetical protein
MIEMGVANYYCIEILGVLVSYAFKFYAVI